MAIHFQSLRSSSSGNCLMLWTDTTTVLIDCGLRTIRGCHDLLGAPLTGVMRIDAVLVTHAHVDHICSSSLKFLHRHGVPIHCHHDVAGQVHDNHVDETWDAPPRLHHFPKGPFEIGDLEFEPFELLHQPDCPTYGFVVHAGSASQRRKIVVCTDFFDPEPVAQRLPNAHFIFVEANHDLELLRRYPNYNSRFHLCNPKTGILLHRAMSESDFAPGTVMLGHLSQKRNSDARARAAIEETFAFHHRNIPFKLEIAPRFEASQAIRIG